MYSSRLLTSLLLVTSEISVSFISTLRVAEGSLLRLDDVLSLNGTSSIGLSVTISAEDGSAKGNE